ncbi:hypothetical protein L198_03176 [Cryptococcus wingfieldii CBS 7118]|uniref:Uncharacterized protein n=1 Tax=Cryptococcus wingfieldii CBS 7118 TaxID=1295528 RepID=A0A1E3JIX1_9TREE|nr:hypothetical protein L198_03176 [Cryptococcus wingfieldii CBS 7118]ODO00849.1 hypothetical protein L198_03176 [Cryptococcus wingfieldii CBS 7118]
MSPTTPDEPALGASKPKIISVFYDEDDNPLDATAATGRPVLCLDKAGKIILGPVPSTIDITVPIQSDDKGTSYPGHQLPPHMLSGPTPRAPASESQTSSQDSLRLSDLQRAQVDPPKLPSLSSLCTSNLGVVRHLHDLQKYFVEYNSRFSDSTPSTPQWRVGQAKSMAKVDAYHYWSMVTGAACVSWESWQDEFRKKALSPNWESETRRVFEGLQCQGSTLAAWTADCLGAITESDMHQKLLFGLPSHILTRVEDRLEDRGLGRSVISLPLLCSIIDRMFRTEHPTPPPAAYSSTTRQFRPAPAATPRPSASSAVPTTLSNAPTHLNGRPLTPKEQGWITNRKLPAKSTDAGDRARDFLDKNKLCYFCRKAGQMSGQCPRRLEEAVVAHVNIDNIDEEGDMFYAAVENDIDAAVRGGVPLHWRRRRGENGGSLSYELAGRKNGEEQRRTAENSEGSSGGGAT